MGAEPARNHICLDLQLEVSGVSLTGGWSLDSKYVLGFSRDVSRTRARPRVCVCVCVYECVSVGVSVWVLKSCRIRGHQPLSIELA